MPRDERLRQMAEIAVKLETETGCPAQLTIAVWATESKWGAEPVGESNYFGIKRAGRHLRFCLCPTREKFTGEQYLDWNRQHAEDRPARIVCKLSDGRFLVELEAEFADYDSLEESARDFAWLITNGEPYQEAWQAYQSDRDLTSLIQGVIRVYATDDYAAVAQEIAQQHNVRQAVARAVEAQQLA